MSSYLLGHGPRAEATPQALAIPGSAQIPNNAGGYAWPVDDWERLRRFLVLGTEGGTYYVGESKLTRENVHAVERCIAADGVRVVRQIVEIARDGRAPKHDPALFALALTASTGDEATRKAALAALPAVARTGTHLLHFVAHAGEFRGWGRALRRAVAAWFTEREPRALAYQLLKYRQRDGWAMRDLLRLAHPTPPTDLHRALFYWATRGWPGVGDEPHPEEALRQLWAAERLAGVSDEREAADLVRTYRLPREAVPGGLRGSASLWAALAEEMPLTALIRNLATLTRVGVLYPGSPETQAVVSRLRDRNALRAARVHPMTLLTALKTYASGAGVRSSARWEPVGEVVAALDRAFYDAFASAPATGKRILVGVDVSGSMSAAVNGTPGMSAREAAATFALVLMATEPGATVVGFDAQIHQLPVMAGARLDHVVDVLAQTGGGGTDCALPVRYAVERGLEVDAIVIVTDSETWYGPRHASQALLEYRARVNPAARLVVLQTAANTVTVGDTGDAGTLACVGFDAAVPRVVADFLGAERAGDPAMAAADA